MDLRRITEMKNEKSGYRAGKVSFVVSCIGLVICALNVVFSALKGLEMTTPLVLVGAMVVIVYMNYIGYNREKEQQKNEKSGKRKK
jgi:Flp pilus assembly protein TadB